MNRKKLQVVFFGIALVAMGPPVAKTDEGSETQADNQRQMTEPRVSRAWRMLELARSRNMPITMYGRVIDQHGKPVEGAKVHMIIAGGGEMAPGTGRTWFVTDADGRFLIKGKGDQIQIARVEHPNVTAYLTLHPSDGKRDEGKLLTAVSHFGEAHSWRTYDRPERPFVLNVWRSERFEQVEFGSGGFYPIPNGEPSELRGLVVSCKRDPKEQGKHWRQQQGSWAITFRPIDGGIQETTDVYLNEAPLAGYEPELTIFMQRGQQGYSPRIYPGRRFYYTAHGGKWHGSFEATLDPFMYDDECRVNADYKYNSNGSRNLAVRPRD